MTPRKATGIHYINLCTKIGMTKNLLSENWELISQEKREELLETFIRLKKNIESHLIQERRWRKLLAPQPKK